MHTYINASGKTSTSINLLIIKCILIHAKSFQHVDNKIYINSCHITLGCHNELPNLQAQNTMTVLKVFALPHVLLFIDCIHISCMYVYMLIKFTI
jgi:hypothetical protein